MTDYEIRMEDEQAKGLLLAEFRQFIESAVGGNNPISRILVTPDFEVDVKRFLTETKAQSYRANHGYGIALGKTISFLQDGQLHFVIIFDSRLFADMSKSGRPSRYSKMIHELIHVDLSVLRFRSVGAQEFFREPQLSFEREFANALAFWEDYEAERTVGEILSAGNIANIESQEKLGLADDTIRDLEHFDSFMKESSARFSDMQMDADALIESVTGKILGIVHRLVYVYAFQGFSEGIRGKIAAIEANRNFQTFFAVGWISILQCLKDLFEDRRSYRADILGRLARAYHGVLIKCGVDIEDNPSGGFLFRLRSTS